MTRPTRITSPNDDALTTLCDRLAQQADALTTELDWPGEQLDLCGRFGVFEWFLAAEHGGQGWPETDLVRGYLRLSAACLTTTFVITQRTGACRRIAQADDDALRRRLLPDLVSGRAFATVGISHLTTSRRHLGQPVLRATETGDGFTLDGYCPWVTGAAAAETIVVGASLDDGRQILVALPTDLPGVTIGAPHRMLALSASQTGPIELRQVQVPRDLTLAGPVENVLRHGAGAKPGGLQTSTLAIGLATAAVELIEKESARRSELAQSATPLRRQVDRLRDELLLAADGRSNLGLETLRIQANSLVLRSTQAALAAAKGAGFIEGHPAGRWCRQALFFLVWSCPAPVVSANMCKLAQMGS